MQVNIRVSRELNGTTMVFEATAGSVAEAIQVANQLQQCKEDDLPAASTDKAAIEKHTGATSPQSKGDINAQDEAAAAKAKADADKKAKVEAKKAADAAAAAAQSQNTAGAQAGQSGTAGETKADATRPDADDREYTYEEVRQKILAISKDKGREPTVAALARFGVVAGKDLKPEQYGDAFKYFTDVIAGKIDPLKPVEEAESEFA